MKLQILSDQHIEFGKNLTYFINRCHKRADTLIIAGDMSPHSTYYDKHDEFIYDKLLTKWNNVIKIPGNHEFFGSDVNDPFFKSHQRKITNGDNVCRYVNNKVVKLNGVTFVCTTLWSYVDPVNAYEIESKVSDYQNIKDLTVNKMNKIHQNNREWLEKTVKNLKDNERCIIITHHVPSYNFISEKWRGHRLNDAFSADMDVFIMNYGHKISHWIHGHSHDELNINVNGTQFIRNPMGYPHERHCDMDLVIEV